MDLATWFVPPSLRDDPRAITRHRGIAKALLAISLLGSLMLLGDILIRGTLPAIEYGLFAAGISTPILGALLIRTTADITLGLVITNSAGILIVVVWAFFSGGIESVALPIMLANLALLSTFGDVAVLLVMGCALAVSLIFLYLATLTGLLPASFIPESAHLALTLTGLLGAAGLIVLAGVVMARDRASVKAHLRSAQLAAEQSSRAKSVFLGSIGSEFRSPLITILDLAARLSAEQSPSLNEQQLGYIDDISAAGKHLMGLMSQVLEMSRIEAGELRAHMEPVLVDDILTACFSITEHDAQKKTVTLSRHGGNLDKSVVWADPALMKQVILNLLSNAIKFNREGGSVTVSIEAAGTSYLRISVIDTGKGIANDRKHELFVPFARLDADIGKSQGAGLGLAIAKNLTDKMHGRIGFESFVGKGSTFWIELPLAEERIALR